MYAIIDIGSNSMRLTVYKIKDNKFKILFKEKSMAGLASYVENGCLNQDGITRACEGLLDFKNTLEMLGLLDRVYVFATASLRNIVNTDDAVAKITAATGFPIDVISGQEEAMLGYIGMMQQYPVTSGAAIDIGGASTELSVFANQAIVFSKSYRVGSLKLYKDCVKNILPGDGSVKRIKHAIQKEFPTELFASFYPQKCMVCTGGTARSVLKVAKQQGIVANDCQQISMQQLQNLGDILLKDQKIAAEIILKVDPARVHTFIPGFCILQHIAKKIGATQLIVSNYGVREGYLCQKVLAQNTKEDSAE